MSDLHDLILAVSHRRDIEQELKDNADIIKGILKDIDLDKFEQDESCSYDALRALMDDIAFMIPQDRTSDFYEILVRKKVQKYPELLKATYFPDINKLPISDEEKVRLDQAARANDRYYMTESNLSKLEYSLSLQDLEMLESVGVVEKRYAIRCPDCYRVIMQISTEDYHKYLQYFNLMQKENLSKVEDKQADELFEEGYDSLYICCDDCDEDFDIQSLNDFEKCSKNFEIMYKVIQKPNLKYERI